MDTGILARREAHRLCHHANPRWSLDDRAILFNSWSPRSDLYTVAVSDGTVKRLTDQKLSNSVEQSWSRDGKWTYFGDDKTGRFEVYRIPAGGGATEQLTRNGGLHAEESVDREWVYYSKNAESPSSIWRVPRDGGQETLMIDGLSYSTNFMPTENGIYLFPRSTSRGQLRWSFTISLPPGGRCFSPYRNHSPGASRCRRTGAGWCMGWRIMRQAT